MNTYFSDGVWPVMLTPFTVDGKVDYQALEELVEWYIGHGVTGLFAVCQSSEMFYLTLEERIEIAQCVLKAAAGRVPVVASGHISESLEEQIAELNAMADTGVDAVVLITNRMAKEDESDEIWKENCIHLLNHIPAEIPLGLYECPYPYRRLVSPENLKWCAETGRFHFMKDVSCDIELFKQRVKLVEGTELKLYNANTTTLLESLRHGASGFSGVMANFHPQLYVWLCEHKHDECADELSAFLSIASQIERQYYPVNAKYHLSDIEGLRMGMTSRVKDASGMSDTFKMEVKMLDELSRKWEKRISKVTGDK